MRHPYASAKRTTDARVAIGAKDIATLTIALLALFVSAIALWAQFFREESNLHLAVPQVFFHFETNEDGTTTGNTFENGVFSRSIIGEYNIAFLDTGNRPVLVKYVNQSIIDITSKNFLLLHDIDARRGDELSKQHLSLDKQQKIVQKYNQEKLNNAPPCVTVIAYPIPSP